MNDRLILDNWKDQKSIYDDVRAPRMGKLSGAIVIDGVVVCETLQCCHCQKHFPVRKDSGTLRGYCMNCMRVTCGKEQCVECMPFLKRCDLIEANERKRRIVDSYLTG